MFKRVKWVTSIVSESLRSLELSNRGITVIWGNLAVSVGSDLVLTHARQTPNVSILHVLNCFGVIKSIANKLPWSGNVETTDETRSSLDSKK